MNETKSKNRGLIVLVIVLSVSLLGALGYICFDKFYDGDSSDINSVEKNNTDNNIESSEVDKYRNYVDSKISERSAGDPYIVLITNDNKEDSVMNFTKFKLVVDKNGNAYLNKDSSSNEKGEMIESKVIDAFKIIIGQAGAEELFLILEDGSVTMIDLGGNVNKNFKNLSKIVSVKSEFICLDDHCMGGSYGPVFTDIDGNIYK